MWNKLLNNFSIFEKKDAFVIQERHYSYAEVRQLAASMQYYILSLKTQNKTIGIYLNNDITTYCLMIASLCSDFCYVPLNPANPAERNLNIIDQAEIDVIFYSHLDAEMEIIQTSLKDKIIFKNASQDMFKDKIAWEEIPQILDENINTTNRGSLFICR